MKKEGGRRKWSLHSRTEEGIDHQRNIGETGLKEEEMDEKMREKDNEDEVQEQNLTIMPYTNVNTQFLVRYLYIDVYLISLL